MLEVIVAENDKSRFAFDQTGDRIRANQGHSVPIDLALCPRDPPKTLYHGTASRFLSAIRQEGLKPGARNHVHLSAEVATARKVGGRHGRPVVLTLDAAAMAQDDYVFYRSDNGVWLTEHVPVGYLSFPPD